MTAIAGVVDFRAPDGSAELCDALLVAQRDIGPHDMNSEGDGVAHLGRCLFRRFPEDAFDCQPVQSERYLLAGDIRLDNRAELIAALGIDRSSARQWADSQIVMAAWRRWGDALFDRLAGNYAIALWDGAERRLVLARDPFGQCPLHLAFVGDRVVFASMPQALRLVPGVDGSPDLEMLASFVADQPPSGPRSFFRGIERIEPGQAISVSPLGVRRWSHWAPRSATLKLKRPKDYVEAYRFYLDQAVESCLRGAGPTVAAHLSGGWDSAAVTATAAIQLAPSRRVIGFTAAPPTTYTGTLSRGWTSDESGRAGQVAAVFANLDHRVVRDRGGGPLTLLAGNDRAAGRPTGHVCNNQWWTAINQAASASGATILLTAEMGNHTLSAGGAMQLADLVRSGSPARWLSEARALAAARRLRWSGILDQSFGPFAPFYAKVRPFLIGARRSSAAADLLAPPLRGAIEPGACGQFAPPRDSRAHRLAMLGEQDCGTFRKAALARWGVDERDPTTERRFVEFCLSLPIEALLAEGVARPLARTALSDRLPAEILDNHTRGLQFADWHEHIAPQEVAALLDGSGAEALLDRGAVDRLIAEWPSDNFNQPATSRIYRRDLLRAVSAASFLNSFSAPAGLPPSDVASSAPSSLVQ